MKADINLVRKNLIEAVVISVINHTRQDFDALDYIYWASNLAGNSAFHENGWPSIHFVSSVVQNAEKLPVRFLESVLTRLVLMPFHEDPLHDLSVAEKMAFLTQECHGLASIYSQKLDEKYMSNKSFSNNYLQALNQSRFSSNDAEEVLIVYPWLTVIILVSAMNAIKEIQLLYAEGSA